VNQSIHFFNLYLDSNLSSKKKKEVKKKCIIIIKRTKDSQEYLDR